MLFATDCEGKDSLEVEVVYEKQTKTIVVDSIAVSKENKSKGKIG